MDTLSNFTPPRDRPLSFLFIRDRPLSVWLHFKWITYVGILDDWAMQKSKKLKIILANMIDCFKVLFVSSEQNHSFYTLFQPFQRAYNELRRDSTGLFEYATLLHDHVRCFSAHEWFNKRLIQVVQIELNKIIGNSLF